jgi:hypothetical protein
MNRPLRATHNLDFGVRRLLKVHPSQGPLLIVEPDVDLVEVAFQTAAPGFVPAPGSSEKSAGVLDLLDIDQVRILQWDRRKDQGVPQRPIPS